MRKIFSLKNRKGFSLVELIIVIAIMVALVAVMAPSMTKYVVKARDQAMRDAAEQCLAYTKSCFGMELTGKGSIQVGANPETNKITVTFVADEDGDNTLVYKNENDETGIEAFQKDLNFRKNINSQSKLIFIIRIECDDVSRHPELATFYIEESET